VLVAKRIVGEVFYFWYAPNSGFGLKHGNKWNLEGIV